MLSKLRLWDLKPDPGPPWASVLQKQDAGSHLVLFTCYRLGGLGSKMGREGERRGGRRAGEGRLLDGHQGTGPTLLFLNMPGLSGLRNEW